MENMNDYLSEENNLRFVYNVLPQTKVDKERFIIPIGFQYNPLKQVENLQILEYEPIFCANCQSVLNPYCYLDFKSKAWECMFCNKKNLFPSHYAQHINETTLPPEVMNENTTVEYKLIKKDLANHPTIFFIIDTTIDEKELLSLKEKLLSIIEGLPDKINIGMITFGSNVYLHEIGNTEMTKLHAFKGDKEYSAQEIQELLLLSSSNDVKKINNNNKSLARKFLMGKSECVFAISNYLDELCEDPFLQVFGQRKQNSCGLALHVAISLLETICNGDPCRIQAFFGNPPTIGLGKICDLNLSETIRNMSDFEKNNDNTKYFKGASEFYDGLAMRASKAGHIIDIFACCFNQTGVAEMRSCVEKTGGLLFISDAFDSPQFQDSISKLFELDDENNLKMNFKGKMEIFVTKPFTINGMIGYCNSVELKNQKTLEMISKDTIGQGGTRVWNIGGILSNSSYSVFLDINPENTSYNYKRGIGQIITTYVSGDRVYRMRVTTFRRKTINDFNNSLLEVAQSFDQETATVLLAKYCVVQGYQQDSIETLRYLDKLTIRVVQKFSEYKKDEILSFKINNKFNMFPQFMYYLRRSPFISDFNCSLDESIYYKSTLCNENLVNCTIMIQPVLYTYSATNSTPTPVHLDIENMKDDVVLFLDAFFFICIWHGEAVCSWREKGLQDQPEYENIRSMLNDPQDYAIQIMNERLPVSKLVSCDSGSGQERYIKFTVNPSTGEFNNSKSAYYSNDINLKKYWEHLKKKVVSS